MLGQIWSAPVARVYLSGAFFLRPLAVATWPAGLFLLVLDFALSHAKARRRFFFVMLMLCFFCHALLCLDLL